MSERRSRPNRRIWTSAFLAFGVFLAVAPALAGVDLVCPCCEAGAAPAPLSAAGLVDVVLSRMLQRGVSTLLFGALLVVSLPWMIAGAALAAVYLPRRLKPRG